MEMVVHRKDLVSHKQEAPASSIGVYDLKQVFSDVVYFADSVTFTDDTTTVILKNRYEVSNG